MTTIEAAPAQAASRLQVALAIAKCQEAGLSQANAVCAFAECLNGTSLRRSRPDCGLASYVWRMTTFTAGIDSHLPVMVFFYLQGWLNANGMADAEVAAVINPKGRSVLDALNGLSDALVGYLGLDPHGAARRWRGLV